MSWLELSVSVDQEAVESVAELLARYGYQGGVVTEPVWQPTIESDGWILPAGGEMVPPPPSYTIDSSQPVILRTYIPMDDQAEEVRQRIEQSLWHLGQMRPIGPLNVRSLEEEDWANTWKQHYHIQRIGTRTVIVPSWLEFEPHPDDIVLHLDPGMAFGTGLHPTTQLCLQLLEERLGDTPPDMLLDLGCGSGILSIAAAKLGAKRVLALDNDQIAVEVTRENVERNGQIAVIDAQYGSIGDDHDQTYGIIVANIIANIIIALAPHLARTLAANGMLITSGIIIDREEEVATALATAGFHQCERRQQGDWVALVYRHKTA